jgi:S1-C subfamily serine protease
MSGSRTRRHGTNLSAMTRACLAMLGAVLLLSCAHATSEAVRTSSHVYPGKSMYEKVDIYRNGQRPDYAYEEVGVVSASRSASTAFGSVSISDLLPDIEAQARTLGADAIMITQAESYLAPALNGAPNIPAARIAGIAIRYIRADSSQTAVLPAVPASLVSLSIPDVVHLVSPSVVVIETDRLTGSGTIIASNGQILTNAHVIDSASTILVKLPDGRRAVGAVVRKNRELDVALLKISLDSLHPMAMGATDSVRIGEEVVVIGEPLGLQQTVSRGIVSALRTTNSGLRYFQTDASVNHGNSGGPLVNLRGQMIGVITWKVVAEGVQGLGFAITTDDALAAVGLAHAPR